MGIKGVKTNKAVGVKGKSGRKSAYEEFYKTRSINRLWEKIDAKIQLGSELSEYEEKLVLALLPKTIKSNIELNGSLDIKKVLDGLE